MRTRNIYILSACLAAVLSCTEFQEENIEVNEAEKVAMTFTASICDETDPETKTVLDGQLGDELRKVLWTPNDEIGIVAGNNSSVEKFTNTETENTETACFEGSIAIADTYYAAYPYSGVICPDGVGYSALKFDLPQTQKYTAGSFGLECAPMVAKANNGEEFRFKNLCGILALNLTGTESVKSITFIGKDANGEPMYVSGGFVVNMNYENVPTMEPAADFVANGWSSSKSVTLECEEPVQLNETEATTFYIALPPATYETFSLIISATDGKAMMKEGTKPLTIKRSDVQPTADLAYVETTVVDLSLNGLANCYIVPPTAGLYSFDATTIGNGDFGLIADAGFHTDNTDISPVSAELLWCDKSGAVTGVSYGEGRITFMSTGTEGNAVIAAKDVDGSILWSWHIWMTDQPAEQVYVNSTGEYTVLDRNLGATRADRGIGDEWKEAQGLVYQWGRKDPFVYYNDYSYTESSNGSTAHNGVSGYASLEDAIKNPNSLYYGNDRWINEINGSLWTMGKKTIYDPCPVGYMVAYPDVWRSFTTTESNVDSDLGLFNVSGDFDNGWDFIYDGVNSSYYPLTMDISIYGYASISSTDCSLWTSKTYTGGSGNSLYDDSYIFSCSYYSSSIWIDNLLSRQSTAREVRCVAEKNTNPILSIEVNDITSTSAKFNGNVSSPSNNDIIAKGFVYGDTPNITIENGLSIECGEGTGDFTADITGLENGLYYVRAYATTPSGTYYSTAIDFIAQDTITEDEKDLVFIVTANYTNNFTVVLPTYGKIDCTVDWGDGNILAYEDYDTGLSHVYDITEPTTFEVRISGTMTELYSHDNGNNSITEVKQWGLTGLTSLKLAFSNDDTLERICDDTIGSFHNVTTFENAWYGCEKLTEIPENLFRYSINSTNFSEIFSSTKISTIPSILFKNCISAELFHGAFQGCPITSLHEDIFSGCPNATDMSYLFTDCSQLTSIPETLFHGCPKIKSMHNTFANCTALSEIPSGLFDNCSAVESFRATFMGCTSITSIPSGLFDNCTEVLYFGYCGYYSDSGSDGCFEGCASLKTIPEKLFDKCSKVQDYSSVFRNCTALELIPDDLFRNMTNAKYFNHTFANCTSLETTPSGTFKDCCNAESFIGIFEDCINLKTISENTFENCTNAKYFGSTFRRCNSLSSIPLTLFSSCTNANKFNYTFADCSKLTSVPTSLFDYNRRVEHFSRCFENCNNLTGESPYTTIDGVKYHLYERTNNAQQFLAPTSTNRCFYNCTGLSDYNSIPNSWK